MSGAGSFGLGAADLAQLAAAGIPRAEAERQLALLASPPPPTRLVRPCTLGDGIVRLSGERLERLVDLGHAARDAGRLSKFVPASGAATRMFRALLALRARRPGATLAELRALAAGGDADARDAAAFVEALPRLALALPLAEAMGRPPAALVASVREEPLEPLFAALLDPEGLDFARLPKALLPFHAGAEGPRTAFAEHLAEGLGYLADRERRARFHFTVPPETRARFEAELGRVRETLGGGVRLEIGFSEQSRATDTLALDEMGAPARTPGGELVLRPSGHGALLANLEATGGDLVAIRNIDNVLPASHHAGDTRWRLALAGLLVELEAAGRGTGRPLRVCGVVPATGEPGGGPFWVEGEDGRATAQIVESSQIARDDPEQRRRWESSTHFNPVDLVLALRDAASRPHELARFVDPATSFVATKSELGRALRVLERPGLWNGAMAGWETLFVEIPGALFAPVKTVLDLARPEHARSA